MDEAELNKFKKTFFKGIEPELQSLTEAAWRLERTRLIGRRYVSVDLDMLAAPNSRNLVGAGIKAFVAAIVTASHPERFRLLSLAMLSVVAQASPWEGPHGNRRRIAQQPVEDPIIRRCVRVLSMVHELHKAGYQKIRILPMIAPNGASWRGLITFSDNVTDNGYTIVDNDHEDIGLVAKYSSSTDNEYFGWKDAKTLNARGLANLFLERFPIIASRGQGCDWAYAGWLTDVLGFAETTESRPDLIHLDQDWPADPDYQKRWKPPPPIRKW